MRKVFLYIHEIGPKRIFFGILTLIMIISAVIILVNRERKLDQKFQTSFDSGEYNKTIEAFESQIYKGEHDPAILRAVSAAYIQKAMAESKKMRQSTSIAISYLESTIKSRPSDDEAYRLLGLAYFVRGEREQAEKNYKKAIEVSGGKNAEAHVGLGSILESKGDYLGASYLYTKALKINPSSESAILGIARWDIYNKQGESAIKGVTPIINSKNKSIQIEAYKVLGNGYTLLNQPEKAISMYTTAIGIGSKDPHTHVLLAQAYIRTYFKNARLADLNPTVKSALAETEQALKIDPTYIYAYTTQYQLYSLQKNTEMQSKIGLKIVSLLPNDKILSQEQKTLFANLYKQVPTVTVNKVTITEYKNGVPVSNPKK